MATEKQARWQCQQCKKTREDEVTATGNSTTPYQFNEANANAHMDANTTHVVQIVYCSVTV